MALVEALSAGLIDVICSDHDPQDVETKRLPFAEAAAGAIGVETMLSASLRLVAGGHVSAAAPHPRDDRCGRRRSSGCRSAGFRSARRPTSSASIRTSPMCSIRPTLHSRCRNTPFDEARLEGRVKLTLVAGRVAHE